VTPDVAESIVIGVPPSQAYQAVTDVRRMARWSPECFGVWIYRRRAGQPTRFVGFNRRKGFVWFTTCKVLIADPDREFAFDVFTFGMPVARWGYRFAPSPGGTEITEYWYDHRTKGSYALGRIFTGSGTKIRPEVNRAGMRTTLERLKRELESG
jgi:Polyketide cyclase / dehydrase and lipid transport